DGTGIVAGGARSYAAAVDGDPGTRGGAGAVTGAGRLRQSELYLAGTRGRRTRVPTDPVRLEERARKAMSREGFAYVAGGAGLESTMAANRAVFERWRIVPRMLCDVGTRDTSVELFGRRLASPFLLA